MRAYYIFFLLVLFSLSVHSQNEYKKWNIGVNGGITQYNGDRGQEFFSFSQGTYGFAGLSLSRFISGHFQISAAFTNGEVGNSEISQPWAVRGDNNSFRLKITTYNLNFQYILNKPSALLRPYFFMGAGIIAYQKGFTNPQKRFEYALPNAGTGISIRLGEYVSLRLQESFMYTSADDLDFEVHDLNDSYLFHTVGVSFNLGKSRDADGDGISDAKDRCPSTPYGVTVNHHGCPEDKDDDGIADHLDPCPQHAGPANLGGCPDKDGDGIADNKDACPEMAGTKLLHGCPDEDNDGIGDKDDKCPGTKSGYAVDRYGCAQDNDKDGVVNEEDRCPNLEGETFLNGCPDTDGDSIADIDDYCPREKGTKKNKGCASLTIEEEKQLEVIASGIYFEKNSARLKRSSYKYLDELIPVLKKYNTVVLVIEGYVGDSGTATFKKDLSMRRSEAVKHYLIKNGIYEGRLNSVCYDEDPKDAKTKNGAAHKGVQLKTIY